MNRWRCCLNLFEFFSSFFRSDRISFRCFVISFFRVFFSISCVCFTRSLELRPIRTLFFIFLSGSYFQLKSNAIFFPQSNDDIDVAAIAITQTHWRWLFSYGLNLRKIQTDADANSSIFSIFIRRKMFFRRCRHRRRNVFSTSRMDGFFLYIRSFHSIYKYLDGNRFFVWIFPLLFTSLHLVRFHKIEWNSIQFEEMLIVGCFCTSLSARIETINRVANCETKSFFSYLLVFCSERDARGSKSKYNRSILGILYFFVQFNDSYGNIFVFLCSRPQIVQKKAKKRRMKICNGSNVSRRMKLFFNWLNALNVQKYHRKLFSFLVCSLCTLNGVGAVQREQVLFFSLFHI